MAQGSGAGPAAYDGEWAVRLNCGEGRPDSLGRISPGFSGNTRLNINQGRISRDLRYARPANQAVTVTEIWSGTITGSSFTLTARGEDTAGARWSYDFAGRVTGPGAMAGEGHQLSEPSRSINRYCTVTFSPANPAPDSLVGMERRRIEQERQAQEQAAERRRQEESRRLQEQEAETRRQAEQARLAEEQRRRQQQQRDVAV